MKAFDPGGVTILNSKALIHPAVTLQDDGKLMKAEFAELMMDFETFPQVGGHTALQLRSLWRIRTCRWSHGLQLRSLRGTLAAAGS